MTVTGVRVVQDNTRAVLASIKRATRKTVLIGVPYNHTARPGDVGVSNAMIGHLNEFGSPTQNIPARPHLVPGVLKARAKVVEVLHKALIAEIAHGEPDDIDKGLHAAGLMAVASVKTTITDRLTPALSPVTLQRRAVKGRTGDLPLIDTGQYLNSITYVIRTTGGGHAAA